MTLLRKTYFLIFLPVGLLGLKKSQLDRCVAFRRYSPTLNTGNNTHIQHSTPANRVSARVCPPQIIQGGLAPFHLLSNDLYWTFVLFFPEKYLLKRKGYQSGLKKCVFQCSKYVQGLQNIPKKKKKSFFFFFAPPLKKNPGGNPKKRISVN